MIKRDGRYCQCFESKMPKMGKTSIKTSLAGDRIDDYSTRLRAWEKVKELPKAQLVAKFKDFGLEPYEIEMIFDRYYDELTWTEMVERRGWASTGAASYVLKRILSKLRKRGFSFDH